MFFSTPGFDLELFTTLNQSLRAPLLDWLAPVLSSKTVLFALLGAALVWLVRRHGRRQIILFAVLLAAMGLTDLCTGVVKDQVLRVRPLNALSGTYYMEGDQWMRRPPDFVQTKVEGSSYPSAHAANSMCLAIMLTTLWPALRRWPLALPLLVGWSRIYLGKHYPTDVLAGWVLGLCVAVAVSLIWTKVLRDRLMPPPRRLADDA